MSTATAPTNIASRQLPMFEGFRVPRTRIAFGGAWETSLTSATDIAIANALKLGAEAKVTIEVDGCDEPIVLGGRVQGRSHAFKKDNESEAVLSTVRLVINDTRPGDDEGEDD